MLLAGTVLAAEPLLTCEPRELRGLPGEPLQLELTVETDRANPIRLRIPAVQNLFLRTVEKIPIQRTAEGRYVQKRILIWQGLEAGSATLTNLTVQLQALEKSDPKVPSIGKETKYETHLFPGIGITIDAVTPAEPPAKENPE